MEVEDDVEFADVAVVFVHLLDVAVHDFEGDEFVVGGVGGGDEEEGGVAAVYYFGVCVVGMLLEDVVGMKMGVGSLEDLGVDICSLPGRGFGGG